MSNDHDLAQQVDRLILESKADWPCFVSATECPEHWADYFADLEPGANLSEWRMDLERGVAFGPDGLVLIS